MQEVFKDIPDYEGIYQVSNLGRVKSLERSIIRSNGYKQSFKSKILSNCNDGRYLYVTLYKIGKKRQNIKIHKLVAITFLNHKPNGYKLVIDHIDHNTLNNNVNNLRLISQRKNTLKDKNNKTSKYNGVSKDRNLWMSYVYFNRKNYYVGRFKTEIEAYNAREILLQELQKEINQLK